MNVMRRHLIKLQQIKMRLFMLQSLFLSDSFVCCTVIAPIQTHHTHQILMCETVKFLFVLCCAYLSLLSLAILWFNSIRFELETGTILFITNLKSFFFFVFFIALWVDLILWSLLPIVYFKVHFSIDLFSLLLNQLVILFLGSSSIHS